MINFKKIFYVTFAIIIVFLLWIAGMVVGIDPYQQYRRSHSTVWEQRLGNPGIAKQYDYDAVIMGSSMAMNHYPSQVDSLFGWKSINLTVAGIMDYDYSILLPYVAKLNKMRHLIITIDYFSFVRPVIPLDLYLYDTCFLNDYEYWFNYTTIKNSIHKLRNKAPTINDGIYHFNSPLGKEYVLKDFYQDNNAAYFGTYNFNVMEQRFDDMLSIIMPVLSNVDVYLYFPPYSIYKLKLYAENGYWEKILDFKLYMIEELLRYPNVKIFDFQKEEYICNLDEYMDVFHHSHTYNKRIIECMYGDSCRVNEDNYLKDLATLDSLVKNYQIEEFPVIM